MVRVHPDPPDFPARGKVDGAIAQLGERLVCIQEVRGSIPRSSTIKTDDRHEYMNKR